MSCTSQKTYTATIRLNLEEKIWLENQCMLNRKTRSELIRELIDERITLNIRFAPNRERFRTRRVSSKCINMESMPYPTKQPTAPILGREHYFQEQEHPELLTKNVNDTTYAN